MRILLDESLPFSLRETFSLHAADDEFVFVQEEDWGGLKNGELLSRAETEYDLLITCDQDLPYQQNLPSFDLSVIVLIGQTNRRRDLESLVPGALKKASNLASGEWVEIS